MAKKQKIGKKEDKKTLIERDPILALELLIASLPAGLIAGVPIMARIGITPTTLPIGLLAGLSPALVAGLAATGKLKMTRWLHKIFKRHSKAEKEILKEKGIDIKKHIEKEQKKLTKRISRHEKTVAGTKLKKIS